MICMFHSSVCHQCHLCQLLLQKNGSAFWYWLSQVLLEYWPVNECSSITCNTAVHARYTWLTIGSYLDHRSDAEWVFKFTGSSHWFILDGGIQSILCSPFCFESVGNKWHICTGLSRMERWKRAEWFGFYPSSKVHDLVVAHSSDDRYIQWYDSVLLDNKWNHGLLFLVSFRPQFSFRLTRHKTVRLKCQTTAASTVVWPIYRTTRVSYNQKWSNVEHFVPH